MEAVISTLVGAEDRSEVQVMAKQAVEVCRGGYNSKSIPFKFTNLKKATLQNTTLQKRYPSKTLPYKNVTHQKHYPRKTLPNTIPKVRTLGIRRVNISK